MADELSLIARIAAALPSRAGGGLRLGIGDDAAVLRPAPRRELVVTCDAFLEGVHFLGDAHPADSVGYKSLARATSDLAAMGARPRWFLLTLALPASRTRGWLDKFLAGMRRAAQSFGLTLMGGDTARNAAIAVSITVLGEAPRGGAITRAGARPGDLIFMSGTPGRAQLGLELVLRGLHKKPRWRHLLAPHLYPEPRLELGCWLAEHRVATSAMDTSDGLSTDLGHLCRASGVGAVVDAARIPAVHVPGALRRLGLDPLKLALHGGEDYELLFTAPPRLAAKLPASFGGVKLTPIGQITRARGILLRNPSGVSKRLSPSGWDHFRAR
jgi:thiamine-monophosphate kinase